MKANKNKLIPELRFPEFQRDEEWKNKIIENVAFSESSSVALNQLTLKKKGYAVYGADSIIGFIDNYQQKENYISIVKDGSGVGRLNFCQKESSILGTLAYIKSLDDEKFDLKWIYYLLNTINFSSYVKGSGIPHIYFSDFKKENIGVPKFKEQQKIASCLSSLDQLITTQKEKLELLKNHKKGLMQNLFPQEGEKVPKYRFLEFLEDGYWREERFDEVFEFLVTNSFSRENLNYENGLVKNIHYGDIHTKFSTLFDITKEDVPFVNSDLPVERIRDECYCVEGDLIFADASEDLEDVGKSIEVVNLNKELLLAGLHTLLARQLEEKLVIGFAGHLFTSNDIRKKIKRESQGAKVLGISKTRIANILISFPKNKLEQQKIVDCLSSLDNLIASQVGKIEQLKFHKKGLMQGLFPKINN